MFAEVTVFVFYPAFVPILWTTLLYEQTTHPSFIAQASFSPESMVFPFK
jgi:hypothetical protein